MKAFKSIEQLRHLFGSLRAYADSKGIPLSEFGVVEFVGRVKIHGTNAGIIIDGPGKQARAQSRTRELTVTSDNAGFAMFVHTIPQTVIDALYNLYVPSGTGVLTVYGEWCGSGVQGGVALSQVEKHFVMFAAAIDDEYIKFNYDVHWNEFSLYNIGQAKPYSVSIDFTVDDFSCLEKHLSDLTLEVEAECPWAKQMFNVEGIGEGIVWQSTNGRMTFKTKGEKHGARQRAKGQELVTVDPEKVATIQECVDIILTENRMQQMVTDKELTFDYPNIPVFLKAVCQDCAKEEIDVVIESGLEWSDVAKVVQHRARQWFLQRIQVI